jgi:hypothetical protein
MASANGAIIQPTRSSTLVLAASLIVAAIAVDVLPSACDTAPTGPTDDHPGHCRHALLRIPRRNPSRRQEISGVRDPPVMSRVRMRMHFPVDIRIGTLSLHPHQVFETLAPAVGQIRIADTGLILAARRAGSQLAASTVARSTAAVATSVSGS